MNAFPEAAPDLDELLFAEEGDTDDAEQAHVKDLLSQLAHDAEQHETEALLRFVPYAPMVFFLHGHARIDTFALTVLGLPEEEIFELISNHAGKIFRHSEETASNKQSSLVYILELGLRLLRNNPQAYGVDSEKIRGLEGLLLRLSARDAAAAVLAG